MTVSLPRRPLAWQTTRKLLRVLEAVVVGRDVCKEHFLEQNGFGTVWKSIAELEALSKEEQVGHTDGALAVARVRQGKGAAAPAS